MLASKNSGFSLIELMVVVAIVGIIAAISYPAYQGYMEDTYRAQAVGDLQACALALDRYYSDDFTYVGADTPAPGVCPAQSPTQGQARYNISYETLNQTNYVIRATPVGGSCGSGDCIELSADGTQSVN